MSTNIESSQHLLNNNLFNEDDEKSRIYDDVENDLLTKLTVINNIYNIIFRNYQIF